MVSSPFSSYPGAILEPSLANEIELDHFLARYRTDSRPPFDRVPDLSDSLAVIASTPGAKEALGSPPESCRTLIEGYAGPSNADALRHFLGSAGITSTDVVAVDLFDLPTTYARLDLSLPRMHFIQADACQLGTVAGDGEFHIVVQDFLLNCLPPTRATTLLAEASRILARHGRLILSVTDSSGLVTRQAVSPARFKAQWGLDWNPHATQLRQIEPDPIRCQAMVEALAGSIILDPSNGHHSLITGPHGRFEFFVPWELTRHQLADAGFETLLTTHHRGYDDHGLDCLRHRLIARHR